MCAVMHNGCCYCYHLPPQDIKPETELDVRILGSLKSDGSLVGTHATNSCVGIGTPTYKALQSRVQELMKERKERSEYLMQLGDKLAELWELLKVRA